MFAGISVNSDLYNRIYRPFDPQEIAALRLWLDDNFDSLSVDYWLALLTGRGLSPTQLLANIARWDAAPFVRLLYPTCPLLFTKPRTYRLDAGEERRKATVCATGLFALCGAKEALEALLELGADPNGMEMGWDYVEGPPETKSCTLLLTPTDGAIQAGEGECQALLERFGGSPMDSLCGTASVTMDPSFPDFLRAWSKKSQPS